MKQSQYNSYDDLPLFLNADIVAKVLGVSSSTSYELMHEPSTARAAARLSCTCATASLRACRRTRPPPRATAGCPCARGRTAPIVSCGPFAASGRAAPRNSSA